jgi:short subunit dehydrogenase-like uncharacterized protein
MIAEEAIRRSHHPILAGRSAERIRPLAEALHLPWSDADLASPAALQEALQGVDAVLLAIHTGTMQQLYERQVLPNDQGRCSRA